MSAVRGRTIAFLLPDMGGGGTERVAIRLMKSFLEAGHGVDLVLMRARGELLGQLPPGVRVVDLGVDRIRSAVRPFMRYLRERGPHAVQVRMWPLTVAALIARRLARSSARIVVSDHAALSKQYGERPLVLAALKLTTRIFYPQADARVVVAGVAADDLARLSGIDRDSIEVIYNPVTAPPSDLRPTPAIEAQWGVAQGRIISVGNLKHQKNHALLIRAFARVRLGREAKLMILGEGELRAPLEQLAAALGVADDVMLPGFTTDPWPYYASANLFVLSSFYEGYPNVLVEAMRCGLPVVATDCESGPREILDGGRFGPLVPLGDEEALATAMARALDDPVAPDALRARAEALSGAGTARRYLELLLG